MSAPASDVGQSSTDQVDDISAPALDGPELRGWTQWNGPAPRAGLGAPFPPFPRPFFGRRGSDSELTDWGWALPVQVCVYQFGHP
jgi:hypothetical protein